MLIYDAMPLSAQELQKCKHSQIHANERKALKGIVANVLPILLLSADQ